MISLSTHDAGLVDDGDGESRRERAKLFFSSSFFGCYLINLISNEITNNKEFLIANFFSIRLMILFCIPRRETDVASGDDFAGGRKDVELSRFLLA